ncbi:MAG: PQQ-binding-like beta-propeller repeat protein, partial [Dokdonella sp.]
MRYHSSIRAFFFITLAWAAGLMSAGTASASEVWRNDWFSSAPPTLNFFLLPTYYGDQAGPGKPLTAAAFSANGDALFGAMAARYWDYQFDRVGADGSLRWSANIYDDGVSLSGAYALLPNDDGGAIIALGYSPYDGDYLNRVIRIDASGALTWSRVMPTGWVVQPTADRIATSGCTRLSVLDSYTGAVLWQRTLAGTSSDCSSGGLVADAQGNLYATVEVTVGYAATGYRTLKFDAQGNLLWEVTAASTRGGEAVAVDAGRLYVATATELRALNTSDGSSAWTLPTSAFANVLLSDDAAHEPIVVDDNGVQRRESDTGVLRWITPLAGHHSIARVTDGAILLAGSDDRAKLDLATGAVAWNLANVDADGRHLDWIGFGPSLSGVFGGVAHLTYPIAYAGAAVLAHIDFASGAIAFVAPADIAQGVVGMHKVDAASDVIGVA